jgi:excisionase family DNA binding protein
MLIDVAESDLMTVAEVAAELRVDQETVRRWLRDGKLRGSNLKGAGGWRIRRAEVQRFLREREPD